MVSCLSLANREKSCCRFQRDVREGAGRSEEWVQIVAWKRRLHSELKTRQTLMEVQRSSGLQQTNMCESTQRSGEPRRKRMDERGAPSEMARIITDPATGKCYCRGKVLGKVQQSAQSDLGFK